MANVTNQVQRCLDSNLTPVRPAKTIRPLICIECYLISGDTPANHDALNNEHTHSHDHSSIGTQHSHSHAHDTNHSHARYRPSESDIDKVRSTIKQLVRDWGEEVFV